MVDFRNCSRWSLKYSLFIIHYSLFIIPYFSFLFSLFSARSLRFPSLRSYHVCLPLSRSFTSSTIVLDSIAWRSFSHIFDDRSGILSAIASTSKMIGQSYYSFLFPPLARSFTYQLSLLLLILKTKRSISLLLHLPSELSHAGNIFE